MPKDTDIALVLPGGGAWIYAQAAALQVLMSEPAIAKNITGIFCNSAGSISGTCLAAGIAQGKGADILMTALAEVNHDEQIYSPGFTDIAAHPLLHPIDEMKILNGALLGESAFDQEPLWALLKKYLGALTTKDIKTACGIELLVRGFDSAAGCGRVYEGLLWRLAALSSAIEVAFKPHLGISDGGPADNAPSDLAIARGYQRILIVYCGAEGPLANPAPIWIDDATPQPAQKKALQVAMAVVSSITALNESIQEERLAGWLREPGHSLVEAFPAQDARLGSILDFSRAAQLPRIQAGRQAGLLALSAAQMQGWVPR